jgi:CheY-like chemotaxis protein
LDKIPVMIFTNSYLSELAEAANGLGIQRAIVKAECSPEQLVAHAREIFSGNVPASKPPGAANVANDAAPAEAIHDAPAPRANVRQQFLDNSANTMNALRGLFQEFDQCEDPAARPLRLENFYRKAHFVSTISGMAECHQIAQLSGALEALLFELLHRPVHIDVSTLHTITTTMDFLEMLFENARGAAAEQPLTAEILIVDDDPLSNHMAVAALRRAKLKARATDNPLLGLDLVRQMHFDLILLDIEMPNMNGFDFCRKLRTLPGYANTPVIYVTAHSDFESRSCSVLAGGNDLIAKPIFPVELALKAVMHLLKRGLSTTAAGL